MRSESAPWRAILHRALARRAIAGTAVVQDKRRAAKDRKKELMLEGTGVAAKSAKGA